MSCHCHTCYNANGAKAQVQLQSVALHHLSEPALCICCWRCSLLISLKQCWDQHMRGKEVVSTKKNSNGADSLLSNIAVVRKARSHLTDLFLFGFHIIAWAALLNMRCHACAHAVFAVVYLTALSSPALKAGHRAAMLCMRPLWLCFRCECSKFPLCPQGLVPGRKAQ